MDAQMSTNIKPAYSVEVIGFNQTERIVLSSIFGLSARREPKFLQHATIAYAPDLYLVDSADSQAVALFMARNASFNIPAIFIGDNSHGTPFPALARPLQWTKLFKAFDIAITTARVQSAPATAPAPTPAPAAVAAPQQPTAFTLAPITPPEPTPAAPPVRVAPAAPQPPADQFEATLPTPVVAARLAAVQAAQVAQAAAQPAAIKPAPPAPPPQHAVPTNDRDWVLVVDDNITVREFMKNKLAPFGFNVDYAESGEQAVGLTGQKSYTCVFLDVIMPGIDGYQVCKLVKSKRAATKTAVIMLTSKGSPFDRIRGAMAGCDAYLTKPVDEDKLLETIVKFLPVTNKN
jgi:two-component system, cell cycle response regulator